MNLQEVRDNNYLQPNRMFTIRGKVAYIEKETAYTLIRIEVFNYFDMYEKPNRIEIYFRKNPKKVIDNNVSAGLYLSVMGDILVKDRKIYFDGKIVEIIKDGRLAPEDAVRRTTVDDANYDVAF